MDNDANTALAEVAAGQDVAGRVLDDYGKTKDPAPHVFAEPNIRVAIAELLKALPPCDAGAADAQRDKRGVHKYCRAWKFAGCHLTGDIEFTHRACHPIRPTRGGV